MPVGAADGASDGLRLGASVGCVGAADGTSDGTLDGASLGLVGPSDGALDGTSPAQISTFTFKSTESKFKTKKH